MLVVVGRLIRGLHDAAQDYEPPAGAVWGSLPGQPHPNAITLSQTAELVSHSDYFPGNVVFRAGTPVALIDFDLAGPTTRVYDIANALYWWAPLLDPIDRAPALIAADVPSRVAGFADAYGMTDQQRAELMPLAVGMIHNFHLSARAAADADPVFRRLWDQGVRDRMPRAEKWIRAQAGPIVAAL